MNKTTKALVIEMGFEATEDGFLEAMRSAVLGSDLTLYGVCEACSIPCTGVEPDAEGYTCEHCGEPKVTGAENYFMGVC